MAETENNTPRRRAYQLPEQPTRPTKKRWQLICQNRAFIAALHAAIRSGSETAAGITATVRPGRKETQARSRRGLGQEGGRLGKAKNPAELEGA